MKNGEEPKKAVTLTTLNVPTVTATSNSKDSITLSWEPVNGATEYQIFEYSKENGLFTILNRVAGTSVTFENLEPGSTHSYIVQPISYIEIADNVSPKYLVEAICGMDDASIILPSTKIAPVEENTKGSKNVIMPTIIGIVVIAGSACILTIVIIKNVNRSYNVLLQVFLLK